MENSWKVGRCIELFCLGSYAGQKMMVNHSEDIRPVNSTSKIRNVWVHVDGVGMIISFVEAGNT